jgi:hypothetical protein
MRGVRSPILSITNQKWTSSFSSVNKLVTIVTLGVKKPHASTKLSAINNNETQRERERQENEKLTKESQKKDDDI